jgi:hypothetical protein
MPSWWGILTARLAVSVGASPGEDAISIHNFQLRTSRARCRDQEQFVAISERGN